jgi:beta-glucanase (GH16 family)
VSACTLVSAFALVGCASSNPRLQERAPVGWTLVWQDEFNGAAGSAVDARYWTHDVGDGCAIGNCGWGNNEKEHYTAGTPNASLNGRGQLEIVARVAPPGLTCYYGPCRYTSAKMHTKGKVHATHGRVEARIRLAKGQGLWPAFWMLGSNIDSVPWPASGELDIMENHGSNVAQTSSAIHGPGYSGDTPFVHGHELSGTNYADAFHNFAVEWDSTHIAFLVDGAPHYEVTRREIGTRGAWPFDQPFYVILNLAVGGAFDGDPKSDAILPATMLVDWVRVYRKGGA